MSSGDGPQVPETRSVDRFAVAVAGTAAVAIFLGAKFQVWKPPWLHFAWTPACYLAIPLAAAVLIDGRRAALARSLAAAAAVVALAMPAARAWGPGLRPWFADHPDALFASTALSIALSCAAARAGGTDVGAWGLGLGNWRWWLPRTVPLVAAAAAAIAVAALVSPELRDHYPEDPVARDDLGRLLHLQLGQGLYMLGWEAFWRGFLLFGVARAAGNLHSLLWPSLAFMMMHRGGPQLEMAASFPGAVLLGAFCLRAGSFWPAVLVHWALNCSMDLAGFWW